MIEIVSTHQGDLLCDQDTKILGSVLGNVTVLYDVYLLISGSANQDVVFEEGSSGEIRGSVLGSVTNKGADVTVRGFVNKLIDEDATKLSRIEPDAEVSSYSAP